MAYPYSDDEPWYFRVLPYLALLIICGFTVDLLIMVFVNEPSGITLILGTLAFMYLVMGLVALRENKSRVKIWLSLDSSTSEKALKRFDSSILSARPLNFEAKSLAVGILLGVIIGGLAVVSFSGQLCPPEPPPVTTTVTERLTSTTTLHVTTTATTCPTIIDGGKWLKPDDPSVISYLDAGKYVGQTKTVEGIIVDAYRSNTKTIFLNFHDPYKGYFTAVIFSSALSKFKFAPEIFYEGKEVRVTGKIQLYQGAPEIVVESPSQIEVANMGFNYP